MHMSKYLCFYLFLKLFLGKERWLYDWLVSDNDADASSAIMVAKNISSRKWHAAIKIVNKTFD